jgi:hypothetical protein
MFDDWGILCPHEFQLHAIHNIAFHCDWLIYIIANRGSEKSMIPVTVGYVRGVCAIGRLVCQAQREKKKK